MAGWIMGIVGVVCLGVLLDLVIPEGQTAKYIKGVFALVVIFVIISPLPALLGREFKLSFSDDGYFADQDYLLDVARMREAENGEIISVFLKNQGLDVSADTSVVYAKNSVKGAKGGNLPKIEKVVVFLSGQVINDADKNIHISSVRKLASKLFLIDEDNIQVIWNG